MIFHLNEIQSLSWGVKLLVIHIMHNKFLEESGEPRNFSNYVSPQLDTTSASAVSQATEK